MLAEKVYALLHFTWFPSIVAFSYFIKVFSSRLTGGYTYWGREVAPLPPFKMENQKPFLLPRLPYKYDASNIEATAYALLVYVARQELLETEAIMKWLNSQRLTEGGWASTQVYSGFIIHYTFYTR